MDATGEASGGRASVSHFADGLSMGIGSLPHVDADAAAAFAISEFDIATIPSLPQRSAQESILGQAVAGLADVRLDEGRRLELTGRTCGASTDPPLDGDGFVGMRAFLDLARRIRLDGSPVKWQFVGPVTLGCELHRAGMAVEPAFELASQLVAARVTAMARRIGDALPTSPQLVLLDEPSLVGAMRDDFPIPPDAVVDMVSSAMATASLGGTIVTGVHCCAPTDLSLLLASGPQFVSVPVDGGVVEWAGQLSEFLDVGGHVAWGVVRTVGPVPPSVERPWHELSDAWCSLVRRGCDAVLLRRQSTATPVCGLGNHSVSVARRIARQTAGVGRRINEQSTATRMALGA
jgi:hypothetical protein